MKTLVLILTLCISIISADVKEIKKSIPAKNVNYVELLGINGSEIEVRTWEKDEVSVAITVDYSSSSKDKVKDYLQRIDLTESTSNGRITLTYKDVISSEDGFSFSRFFNNLFSSYSHLKISGTITIPATCALSSDMRYGQYTVDGVKGNLHLSGVANNLTVRNCSAIQKIENDYGTTVIEHSGGELSLKGESSTITLNDITGPVKADANYSTIAVNKVTADLYVRCASGRIDIADAAKSISMDADYSTISVINTGGWVTIKSQSANIKVKQAGNVDIHSLYSNVTVESVNGGNEPVELITGSGQTELSNISRSVNLEDAYSTIRMNNILGNVTVDGNTTNIQGRKITGNLLVTNQYAEIEIGDLTAPIVEITNKSNSVRLELLTKPTKLQIENEYGSVDLLMPEFSGDVKLKATYGEINTNLPVEIEDMGESAFAIGKIGSGTGTMNVKTVSGNIDIRLGKR